MKLAIVGSRHFNDKVAFEKVMTDHVAKHGMPELVVSGGAKGADTLGEQWARKHKIKVLILKPDWKKHGDRAGLIRNHDIVKECNYMIAFPSKSNGSGTQHSISIAKANGIETSVFWQN